MRWYSKGSEARPRHAAGDRLSDPIAEHTRLAELMRATADDMIAIADRMDREGTHRADPRS